ncbi:MAG: TonB-dependent receptor [Ignavibacterium sp.]|nr:TonB-dependent receptor [Ignavibacterium sp.]MDW8376501.1 TonB-dependent receptor [Ignavibacteriales bacterium]
MKNIFYKITSIKIIILLLFALSELLFAGITGKIAGKVTDAETGEPLVGINVIIEGTGLGAATNVDGNYVINNVEPGTYNLIFSGVGYQKKIVTNVKVSSDFTTRIDVQLSVETIGLETIVVEAKRPLVRKDLTSSHTVIDNTQIEALPVESVDQLLALQAGITKGAGGELHIRGGRSTEIAYNVNGISSINPYDYGRTVQISTNAIQELSVVSGTFNAEYGNALSGVVNAITKEGGLKYTGSLSYYTGDYISARKNIFLNIGSISPVNNQVIEGTFGGPIPYTNGIVSFFLSGRYNDDKGYFYGIRQHTIYDSVYRNPNNADDIRISMTGDNAIVPMNPSKDLNLTGKFTVKPIPSLKINYDIVFSNSNYKTYNHELKYNPDANYNRYEWGLINSLEIRQTIGSNTFYSLKGAYSIYDFKRYLFPLLNASGKAVSFRPGMSLTNIKADPRYQPSHKSFKITPYTFLSGGTLNEHFYQRSYSTEIKFDLTSQVSTEHELKFGVKGKYDILDYQYFTILRDSSIYRNPTIPPVNSLYHDLYSRKPVQFSAYLQDKMEFTNMIINAGLRFDYLNPKSKYAPNIFKPASDFKQAKAKSIFSPRLGISFPITDRGIIHFSYGHFYQIPPFRYLYTNPDFKNTGSRPTYGNANLNPEKTVTYEMGLQQQLSETIAFNLTGFYKDVRDLLALQEIRISTSESYLKYVNKDYANIKGITFSLTKRKLPDDLFGATLDYTFQVAEGNETGASAFFLDLSSGRQSEKIPVPLAWDQTHTLNGTITFGSSKNWVLSLVGSISSGLPYTPELIDQQIYLKTNSERKPISMNVDLLFEKSFDFKVLVATLFIKVFNLFDTMNERFVYDDTGRATYTLEASKGGPQETNRLSKIIPGIKSADEYFNRPHYYSAPREVRIGLSLEF